MEARGGGGRERGGRGSLAATLPVRPGVVGVVAGRREAGGVEAAEAASEPGVGAAHRRRRRWSMRPELGEGAVGLGRWAAWATGPAHPRLERGEVGWPAGPAGL